MSKLKLATVWLDDPAATCPFSIWTRAATSCSPACVATVYEGMEVSTNTERLKKHRRMILEMLFAERNHICAVCVSNGHCELQTMGQEQGLTHIRLPYRNPELKVDASHGALQWTTTAASSARAASGCAPRLKARISGT